MAPIQGDIVTCSINRVSVYTINGHHIASLRLSASEPIFSMALHERETSLIPILACGSTNGTVTLRTWNADESMATTGGGGKEEKNARWKVTGVRVLKLRKETRDEGWVPGVSALRFVGCVPFCPLAPGSASVRAFPSWPSWLDVLAWCGTSGCLFICS
jgi:hypothetical protein